MKKFIILLMLISGTANAEQWFEMPNKAGGKMVLLTTKCSDTESGRIVISTTPEGYTTNGCWWYFAEMVNIVWKSGNTSSFEGTAFTLKGDK